MPSGPSALQGLMGASPETRDYGSLGGPVFTFRRKRHYCFGTSSAGACEHLGRYRFRAE